MPNARHSFLSPSCSDLSAVTQIHSVLSHLGRAYLPEYFRSERAEAVSNVCRDSEYKFSVKGQHTNYELAECDVSALEVTQNLYDACQLSDLAETGALTPGVLADFFPCCIPKGSLSVFRAITGDARI